MKAVFERAAMLKRRSAWLATVVSLAAGCSVEAALPVSSGVGRQPELPPPDKSLIPTLHIATATGWHGDAKPKSVAGTSVNAFAVALQHPRWLYSLPNGDVLVGETEAPAKPDDGKGLRGKIQKSAMQRAGSGTASSANRITLLRDTDGDGAADVQSVFVANLNSPFGMALVGNDFYVAATDALWRFPWLALQLLRPARR